MPVYQVSYDLHPPEPDYARLEAALQATFSYYHVLGSTWLLWTRESADQLQKRLLAVIHKQDRLLLSRVTRENGGWMSPDVWAWLNPRLVAEPVATRAT